MNAHTDASDDSNGGCRRAREQLVLHAYGELDPAGREELERHLAACGACRGEQRALRADLDLLGRWEVPDPGEDARAAARRAAAASARRVRRTPRFLLPLAAAAALLALLVAFGARARYAGGELTLSLHLPRSAPARPAALALERRVAELERASGAAQLAQADVRAEVRAVRAQLAEADLVLSRVVGAVARDSALENRRTRDALLQLASVVTVEEPR